MTEASPGRVTCWNLPKTPAPSISAASYNPERGARPDHRDDHRPQGKVVIGQPLDEVLSQAEAQRQHVEQPDLGAVIHPLPGQAGDQTRNRPRQEKERPEEGPTTELLVQQQRQRHPEPELQDVGHNREQHRDPHRLDELRAQIAADQQVLVVLQADPYARSADQLGLEAEQDRGDERVADQAHQNEHARHQEKPGSQPIAPEHAPQLGLRADRGPSQKESTVAQGWLVGYA